MGRRRVGTVDVTVRRRTDTIHVRMLTLFHVLDNVLLLLMLLMLVMVMLVLLKLDVSGTRESIATFKHNCN
jgi:hypothetical protein